MGLGQDKRLRPLQGVGAIPGQARRRARAGARAIVRTGKILVFDGIPYDSDQGPWFCSSNAEPIANHKNISYRPEGTCGGSVADKARGR